MMEGGLNTRLTELESKIDSLTALKEKKPRDFKIPFRAKVSNRKVKDNWVTIIKLNENGGLNFEKDKIQQQTVIVEGVPRIASGDFLFHHKGKPFIIQPSWSVEPIGRKKEVEKSMEDGTNIKGFKLWLERAKLGNISQKKKLSLGWIIGGLIAIGIIAYVIFG